MGNMAMAPIEVTLSGLTYLMSPLTDRDRTELTFWVRDEFLKCAKLAAGKPGEESYEDVMRLALREAATLYWDRFPGVKIASANPARLAWQGMKRNYPELKESVLYGLLSIPENLVEFRNKFALVNDSKRAEAGEETAPSADPTRSRSSTPYSSSTAPSTPAAAAS